MRLLVSNQIYCCNAGRAYWVNHRTRQTSWQPPEALSRPLPPSWEVRVDPQTGRTYYVNHANGSTHWEIPESAYQAGPQTQTSSANGIAPSNPPLQGNIFRIQGIHTSTVARRRYFLKCSSSIPCPTLIHSCPRFLPFLRPITTAAVFGKNSLQQRAGGQAAG